MSFNKPVECEFSFQGFTKRSAENPDGWGIALYPGGGRAAQVLKEPHHKAMGITGKKMQLRLENLEILRNWAKDLPAREE
jgi:hypothetical protein